ncbi:MAG: ATPase [Elusimicrobia bacterium RIFOXYB2_FULL_49_7]|nr:MAG: ATPase [Elusimicrobia bacterium RIFOXYB2_FULL_49_7]
MFNRNIIQYIKTALSDTPVIFLNGARQTGKSTLVSEILTTVPDSGYHTLDDAATLSLAVSDPTGFIHRKTGMMVIDEIQKAPALFSAIKTAVDKDRRPGSFLLTGSANVLLLPRIAESLAGRMEVITLYPLSQGELAGHKECFVDYLLSGKSFDDTLIPKENDNNIEERIITGGFPEPRQRPDAARREAWFGAYMDALLQRDIRQIANITGLTELPRLLSLIASRQGSTLNMAELSRGTGIPHVSLKRYLTLLETAFLIIRLTPWYPNTGKRMVKSPKLFLCDTGLSAWLMGVTQSRLTAEALLRGPLLEAFTASELKKQLTWSIVRGAGLHFFRVERGPEVDFVIEDRRGRIVGIEVKASMTLRSDDFAGLKALADQAGDRFVRGIVLYCGSEILSFEPTMTALPVSCLWTI